jgi:RecA/RadA recombinase
MAAQVAANAQKMGVDVVYFDAESAIDPEFLGQRWL